MKYDENGERCSLGYKNGSVSEKMHYCFKSCFSVTYTQLYFTIQNGSKKNKLKQNQRNKAIHAMLYFFIFSVILRYQKIQNTK